MKSWQRQKFGMTFSQCDGGWTCADLHSHALHKFVFCFLCRLRMGNFLSSREVIRLSLCSVDPELLLYRDPRHKRWLVAAAIRAIEKRLCDFADTSNKNRDQTKRKISRPHADPARRVS